MTGRVVERDARTANLSASVLSTGVSALMPPHSQGAERRRAHRAGRTGSRWGLRALVVGGLAGAAWLLTGAAAHAADRDPAVGGLSLGSSLIGSVVHGDDHTAPVVDRVLKAATKPLESDDHRGIDSVVRGLTAPLHLFGGLALAGGELLEFGQDLGRAALLGLGLVPGDLQGVATLLGVLIALLPLAAVVYATIWLLLLLTTRISSLAGMAAAISPPISAWLLGANTYVPILLGFTLLVLWKHRENIRRLSAGTEPRVGKAKA